MRHFNTRAGRIATVLLAWATILLTGQIAPAQLIQPVEGARTSQPAAPAASPLAPSTDQHWLKKLTDVMIGPTPIKNTRSDLAVLNAFRTTVAIPTKCTARVWCGERQVALGTIVDAAGFIATKASELEGAITCELSDGTRHDAQLVGVDRSSDLALLKITRENLTPISWSSGDPPLVGGWVVTPGLSDVPQAIGIVSVAAHPVRGGVLGIQMAEDKSGPRITYVVPGSGAASANLSKNDIITHANGKPMNSSDDMVATTSSLLPGDKVELTILRLGKRRHLSATLGSVATTLSSRRARFQDHLGGPLSKRRVLFPSALEHDSVLAPNQCGGALVNLEGEAIGLNIARASRISCFAIPARIARPILESLKSRAAEPMTVPVAAQLPKQELSGIAIEQ